MQAIIIFCSMLLKLSSSDSSIVGMQDVSKSEKDALRIVSYIGCGISFLFLALTIVFYLAQG